jgi:serine/threonine-protein kinase
MAYTDPTSKPALKPGGLILNGKYRVVEFLGQGAFAQVYRVHHLELKADRAVKVVSRATPGVGSTVLDDFRARFRQEAQLGARLDHPHVIRIYDFEEAESRLCLVMEYAAGGSLARRLRDTGLLPVPEAVRLTLEAAAGLEAMHGLGAVHRDVKPSNLLLDVGGHIKLADLGLAQLPGGLSQRSIAGSIAPSHPGTPEYMSPEQETTSAFLTASSDVYSLGCVLFELLTGRLWKQAMAKAEDVRELRSEVPEGVAAVLARMLREQPGRKKGDADDPAKRYVTMEGVRQALQGGPALAAPVKGSAAVAPARGVPQPTPLAPLRAQLQVAIGEGRWADVVALAQHCLELAPEDADARTALGLGQQHEQEAVRQAAEVATHREAEQRLDEINQQTQPAAEAGRWHEAVRLTQQVLAEAPQGAAARAALRQAQEQLDRQEAEQASTPVWKRIGIEMVPVPAGEFLYGANKREVRLPDYCLARTPVTNAQYRAFVQATSHRPPLHWRHGEIPRGEETHPVVYVSWEDARAFCKWAGCRLPTEQEWEKGARGTDGREYPWGNGWETGRCNSFEAGIGDTTPVGEYPAGASPYGLLDMAGNVWEWCEDPYGRKHKAVRGGSWHYDSVDMRCASRSGYNPMSTNRNLGFRCCMSSASSP